MTAVFQGSFLSDVPLDFVQLGQGFYLGRFDEKQLDVQFTKAGLVMTKTISISGIVLCINSKTVLKII